MKLLCFQFYFIRKKNSDHQDEEEEKEEILKSAFPMIANIFLQVKQQHQAQHTCQPRAKFKSTLLRQRQLKMYNSLPFRNKISSLLIFLLNEKEIRKPKTRLSFQFCSYWSRINLASFHLVPWIISFASLQY